MEIYRQQTNRIYFTASDPNDVVVARVYLNGGTVVPLTVMGNGAPTPTTSRYVDIPYINDEGILTLEWSWTGQQLTVDGLQPEFDNVYKETYEVVTPILGGVEIKKIHPNATSEEIIAIEKAVRHIISAHTGQKFGRSRGVKKVRGTGSNALFLPDRLLSLEEVNGGAGTNYVVDADGYILRFFPWGVPPVKADAWGLHMHVGGVIHNPNGIHLGEWDKTRTYEINGVWGWESVPSQVQEAAKLLVNDYACADNAYRDRFLTSMTAADWRIQFNSGAFHKTGNVRADQLLSDYVLKRGWAVI